MVKRISDITNGIIDGKPLSLGVCPVQLGGKNRVNILALGDVGATMLIGLKLLGRDVISRIGICDINRKNCARLEMEMNQIGYPDTDLPEVRIVDEKDLFDCDVMIFCASKGVPPVEEGAEKDVRMAQLDANREIIDHYAALAKTACYRGLVCIVSDPVDNLAAAFLDVLTKEPPQHLPQAPNLYITPHLAWATREARERLLHIATENIRAFLEGKPRNVVS